MKAKFTPYWRQKEIKSENQSRILGLLNEEPRKFKDLLELTDLSPAGLTKILQELEKENKIEKITKERTSPYKIAGRGTRLKDIFHFGNVYHQMKKNGCKYILDYSGLWTTLQAFSWGILSHLIIEKRVIEGLQLLSPKDQIDIEKFVFNKILKNVKQKEIKYNSSKKGKMLLALEFDYPVLIKSIQEDTLKKARSEGFII